ncbi:uncharacterized protein HMPREF1541_00483 [Cyphellophora europaea CBS 101466]|uniref:Translation initiation factor eIF2B subunit gamma n=1 Tax=Cyphellophora europaea (strain CBS 101466) TaxID=1220924 RepID=W2SEF9_CYPE1|nr:uncharacterized protein HMPREF1541_00483 [Cyphellophora europaea CBS 101466]ETN46299.1 hypothetical protein HMPREF1541_00483 [Cyphellophora europaea CBS 101466]
MATRTTSSMTERFEVEAESQIPLVDDIVDLNTTSHGLPESAPGQSSDRKSENSPRLAHQRVQFIKLSSIARTVRGYPGATPPFLPAAPSLLRVAASETEGNELLAPPREPSPLRQVALSNYASAPRSKMPHAVSMPQSGFQALVLCGPGIGLNTFTSVPKEFPKALVEVANRPMVWYVLDWCYRMGVTDITLVTPPESKETLAAALAQNPHLTSLPSPSPDLIAPADLEYETATAELLRLPEVQKAINSDFVLLPCDLICEVSGETFLDTYISSLGGLGGVGISSSEYGSQRPPIAGMGGESSGRRGGLSVWYNTANREESVKKEECDFMCTAKLPSVNTSPMATLKSNNTGTLRKLVWTTPMSEIKEQTADDKALRIRSSLLRKHGNVKCLTQYRDAHIYFLPYWVKEFAARNEEFESVSEDLIGTWAKAEWRKPDFRARFSTAQIFIKPPQDTETVEPSIEDEIDLLSFSSTQSPVQRPTTPPHQRHEVRLATRVHANPEDSILSDPSNAPSDASTTSNPPMPPIGAYILPSAPTVPLVRRIDTTPLLLSVNLLLAKTPSTDDGARSGVTTSSPFAHFAKVAATATIAAQVTISKSDSLVGDNTSIATRCVVKNSVIGANVSVGSKTRIIGSVVMDGAVIGEGVELNGTVVGKRAKVGDKSKLTGCEVQDGNALGEGVEGKNETFLVGGLEDDDDVDDDDYVNEIEDGEQGGEGISLI